MKLRSLEPFWSTSVKMFQRSEAFLAKRRATEVFAPEELLSTMSVVRTGKFETMCRG